VLEHVEDPRKLLAELHRILTKNGVIIISTHGFWIEGHEVTDYWRWTIGGLFKIFEESGFAVSASYSMDSYASLFQFVSLFVPQNLFGKPFQVLFNLSGTIFEKTRRNGPSLPAVHIIKATKRT
jgi:SAM-dependent methyltransferase